jgi:Family of unknown function (DUF6221)
LAERAKLGYNVEATSHMTSKVHADHVMRYDPTWVMAELHRELLIVNFGSASRPTYGKLSDPPEYGFICTRILASAYRDHSDFQPRWLCSDGGLRLSRQAGRGPDRRRLASWHARGVATAERPLARLRPMDRRRRDAAPRLGRPGPSAARLSPSANVSLAGNVS